MILHIKLPAECFTSLLIIHHVSMRAAINYYRGLRIRGQLIVYKKNTHQKFHRLFSISKNLLLTTDAESAIFKSPIPAVLQRFHCELVNN